MNARFILPLLALSVTAYAGERETFDFGWQFKYFGAGDPGTSHLPVMADSTQNGHPAAHAIDGNPNTRWTAANSMPGHYLQVDLDGAKIGTMDVLWENAQPKQIKVVCERPDGSTSTLEFSTQHKRESTVKLGGEVLKSVKIEVNGTTRSSWASINEVTFRDTAGNKIDLKSAASAAGADSPAHPGYEVEGFRDVQLPHDWAIESPFLRDEPNETGKLPWNGWGWYRKTFDVPASFDAEKERYYLDFDGVMANPQVYVNGKLAGEWAYGYNSFRVDITPFLKPGASNLVAVMASNKPLSTRWYPGAGIYRHVWLEKTTPVHIAQWGVYVTTPKVSSSSADVKIKTTVNNTSKEECKVIVRQAVGKAKAKAVRVTIKPGESKEVEQTIKLSNPKRWSCEEPNMYTLTTTISSDDEVIDSRETSFGVRTIDWRKDGFYLNGKRVQLNGVCEHHDLGALGAAFHSRGFERKIEKLKEMGCNSIRMTHNPPAPEALDLCDRHGILVIDELFDIWEAQKYDKVNGYHVYWPQWWKKDVQNFVLRDRNHPCIIAWSGGNEIIEIQTKRGLTVSSELRDEFRKYDTTRPYTVGVNHTQNGNYSFADTMDVFGYNYRPFDYARFLKDRKQPLYASETASCVATRDMYFFPDKKDFWNKGKGFSVFQVSAYGLYAPGWAYCPDVEFEAHDKNPEVAGEYVWTGHDYIGEPTPYNQDASNVGNFANASEAEKKAAMEQMQAMGSKAPSRSSYFGIIDLAGFPKDTFYLYQSRWNPEVRQAHILPHWNWKGREGKVTPVMVFSSGDEAELFLNGKSQGVRRKGQGETFTQSGVTVSKNGHRFVWEDVVYEPGELEVVVKKNGRVWAKAKRVTTGEAVKVEAQADRATIAGDARDLSYVELALVDAKGNVVPTDSRKVSFTITGPAELVGFCNGNPVDQTCMQDPNQSFFNGRIVAIVRGLRGKSGEAKVTAAAEGLPEVGVTVKVAEATPEQLRR